MRGHARAVEAQNHIPCAPAAARAVRLSAAQLPVAPRRVASHAHTFLQLFVRRTPGQHHADKPELRIVEDDAHRCLLPRPAGTATAAQAAGVLLPQLEHCRREPGRGFHLHTAASAVTALRVRHGPRVATNSFQHLEMRASWAYALAVGARLALTLSPGYVHPDEYFQAQEVAAIRRFALDQRLAWEFDCRHPCRSALVPLAAAGVPYGETSAARARAQVADQPSRVLTCWSCASGG